MINFVPFCVECVTVYIVNDIFCTSDLFGCKRLMIFYVCVFRINGIIYIEFNWLNSFNWTGVSVGVD